jgi:DNA-binding XRE family transcriptional regulator
MNLLETLQQKLKELGPIEVAKQLDVPVASIKSFEAGKTKPGLVTCQKMLDIWGEPAPMQAQILIPEGETVKEVPAVNVEHFRAMQDDHGAIEVSYCPPEWNEKKQIWKGRDVCLCIASYQFFPGECFTCFMALAMKYRQGIRLEHRHADSMIARSRNQLAKRFLATEATWSIWLDSDMIFLSWRGTKTPLQVSSKQVILLMQLANYN